jgi:hypothetical protein
MRRERGRSLGVSPSMIVDLIKSRIKKNINGIDPCNPPPKLPHWGLIVSSTNYSLL